jgi:hypothetical protein
MSIKEETACPPNGWHSSGRLHGRALQKAMYLYYLYHIISHLITITCINGSQVRALWHLSLSVKKVRTVAHASLWRNTKKNFSLRLTGWCSGKTSVFHSRSAGLQSRLANNTGRYIHPFSPLSPQFFICLYTTQQTKKLFLDRKNIGGGHLSPLAPQVRPLTVNCFWLSSFVIL